MDNRVLLVGWGRSVNYGTNLQTIALYEIINQKYKCDFLYSRKYCSSKLFVKKAIKKLRSKIKKEGGETPEKNRNIDKCYENIRKINLNSPSDKKIILSKYNTFVVGSDQVWNPGYLESTYLLDFVPKGYRKISYASSIGVNTIPKKCHKIYCKYLSDFSYISMREQQGAKCISKMIRRSVDTVLDPTLLLSSLEWKEICSKEVNNISSSLPDKYLLCYFVGNMAQHMKEIQDISKEMNLKIVVLPITEQETRLSEGVVINNAGPKEFVAAVNGATMVCTDSFHMCAFSLNFQKEFWVFKRFNDNSSSSQNSRIDNLFSEFGINRYFNDGDRQSLDYNRISISLKNKRIECKKLLFSAIDGKVAAIHSS